MTADYLGFEIAARAEFLTSRIEAQRNNPTPVPEKQEARENAIEALAHPERDDPEGHARLQSLNSRDATIRHIKCQLEIDGLHVSVIEQSNDQFVVQGLGEEGLVEEQVVVSPGGTSRKVEGIFDRYAATQGRL